MKTISNFSSFEFKPDILGILTGKKSGTIELVFLNRRVSAISLQEIGELLCYCRVANPKEAFLCSLKGLPTEVSLLLLNNEIQDRLLKYNEGTYITIFKWDQIEKEVDLRSVFPSQKKDVLILSKRFYDIPNTTIIIILSFNEPSCQLKNNFPN